MKKEFMLVLFGIVISSVSIVSGCGEESTAGLIDDKEDIIARSEISVQEEGTPPPPLAKDDSTDVTQIARDYTAPNRVDSLGATYPKKRNRSASPVWNGGTSLTSGAMADYAAPSKGAGMDVDLTFDLGYEPFISNTSSPTLDGVVSTEEHVFAGISLGHGFETWGSVAYMSFDFEAIDDGAYMGDVGISYGFYAGPGAFDVGVGYAFSEDGDETLMEEGFTGYAAYSTDSYGLSVAYNEGNGYDDQEKYSMSYTVSDNLAVGAAYSETHGIGEYDNDVYVTSVGATYDFWGGMAFTLGVSHTAGFDTGTSESVDHDDVFVKTSFAL